MIKIFKTFFPWRFFLTHGRTRTLCKKNNADGDALIHNDKKRRTLVYKMNKQLINRKCLTLIDVRIT